MKVRHGGASQNKVQLRRTLYQWFLHIVAVGGLCMPTNEYGKGGERLATGQLSNSSPSHHHTYQTHIQTSLIGVLGPGCFIL